MSTRGVAVVLGRCAKRLASYGMRMERQSQSTWIATWAFPIREAIAKREGYDRVQLNGSFQTGKEFPGCPHCEAKGFFRCGSCGAIACWDAESIGVTCPTCHTAGELSGEITQIAAGGDA